MRKSVRNEVYFIIGIFVFAFAIRFIYLTQMKSSPFFDFPTLDSEYNDQWAQMILRGEDFEEGVFFRAPLYPYFLAFVYKVFGHNYLMPRLIQLLIGSLSCLLIYLLGKRIFNKRTGRIAGVVASLYGVLIYFDGELLIPVLPVFLNLLLLLVLIRVKEQPSYKMLVLCGVLLGLSALARPNILLVGSAFFFWILLGFRKHGEVRSKRALYACCFALGTILIISPVTLRNYIKGDDFVLIASQGGMNFYIGNNPHSDGVSAVLPGTRTTWWGMYEDAKTIAEKTSNRSLKPSEVSRFWYMEGLRWIMREPFTFLKLMLKKIILFWNGNELSNNRDFYFFSRSAPLLKLLIWRFVIYFPFGLFASLALVGMVLSHKEKKDVLILEIFLFTYMLSIILFFVNARFRVPVIPILILFSACALDQFISRMKQRKFSELGKYLLFLLIVLIPVNFEIPGYSTENTGQAHYTLGVVYNMKGDTTKAAEQYEKALQYNSNLAEAYANLGSIYGHQGKHELSIEYYQIALQKGLDSAFVFYNIGIVYHQQGLLDQAQKNYELSLSIRDKNPKVHYLLGGIYLRKQMLDQAVEEYNKTIRDDPGFALAYYQLGTIYNQMGKREEAIEKLETFVRLGKGEPGQIENATRLLRELKGKPEK